MLRTHGMTIEDLRDHMVKSPAVPEPEPEAPVEGLAVRVKHDAFDAIASLERIRWFAEDLARSQPDVDDTHSLIDEIHHHLDALKQHLA
jgi:hypothetical protein